MFQSKEADRKLPYPSYWAGSSSPSCYTVATAVGLASPKLESKLRESQHSALDNQTAKTNTQECLNKNPVLLERTASTKPLVKTDQHTAENPSPSRSLVQMQQRQTTM